MRRNYALKRIKSKLMRSAWKCRIASRWFEDRAKDQIEYVNEDKWVREKFEGELARKGLTSLMPSEAYTDPSFEWNWSPFIKSAK